MAWSIEDIPDLEAKTAVVTGANSGLGLESAKALAVAGAQVVMTARSEEKAAGAVDAVREHHDGASLEPIVMDLASLASVRQAADTIAAGHASIDVLINNAGVMATPEGRTEDGFETQLGVNHLGHWVLTARLLRSLLAAEEGRVVSVTSTAHHGGRRIDPENPNLEGRYGPWRAYFQSKLANYHFALGLHRELRRRGLPAKSLLAHPGLSRTNLQVTTEKLGGAGPAGTFFERLAARSGMEPERGALPQLRAATEPGAEGGWMYAPRFVNSGAPVKRPILRIIGLGAAIRTLWEVSQRLTGEALPLPDAP